MRSLRNFINRLTNQETIASRPIVVKDLLSKLAGIRKKVINADNRYKLTAAEMYNVTITLNTLEYITENIEAQDFLWEQTTLDPKQSKSGDVAIIHLEEFTVFGEERRDLILRTLVDLFIYSFEQVKKAETKTPGTVKSFCSKLSGLCIDSRTRSAFTYALTLGNPTFTEMMNNIIDNNLPADTTDYFTTLSVILKHFWGKSFKKDDGTSGFCKSDGLIDSESLPLISDFLKNVLSHDVDKSFLNLYMHIPPQRLPVFLIAILNEIDFVKTLDLSTAEQKLYDELILPSDASKIGLLDIALERLHETTEQCNPNTTQLDYVTDKQPEKSEAKVSSGRQVDLKKKAARIQHATNQLENHRAAIDILLSKLSPEKQRAFLDTRKKLRSNRTRSQTLARSFTLDGYELSTSKTALSQENKSEGQDRDTLTAALTRAVVLHCKQPKKVSFPYLEALLCGVQPDVMMTIVNQQIRLFVDLAREHKPKTEGYKAFVHLIDSIIKRVLDKEFKSLLNNSPLIAFIIEHIDEKNLSSFLQKIDLANNHNKELRESYVSNNILNSLVVNKKFKVFEEVSDRLSNLGDLIHILNRQEPLTLAITHCNQNQIANLLIILQKHLEPEGYFSLIQTTLNRAIVENTPEALKNFLTELRFKLSPDRCITLFTEMVFPITTPLDNIMTFIMFGIQNLKVEPQNMAAFCLAQDDTTSIYLHTLSVLTDLTMSNEEGAQGQIKIAAAYRHKFIKMLAPNIIQNLPSNTDSTIVLQVAASACSQLPPVTNDNFEAKEVDPFAQTLLSAISQSDQAIRMIDFVLGCYPRSDIFDLMKKLATGPDKQLLVLFTFLNSPQKDLARFLFVAVCTDPVLNSIFNCAPIKDQNELICSLTQPIPVDDEKKQDDFSADFQTTLVKFIEESTSIGNMVEAIASGLSEENIIRLVKKYRESEPELFVKIIETLRDTNKAKVTSFLGLAFNDFMLTELFKSLPMPTQNNLLIGIFAKMPSEEKSAESCVAKISTYLVKAKNQNRIIAAGKALVLLNTKPINHLALENLHRSVLADHHNIFAKSDLATYIGDYLKTVPGINAAPKVQSAGLKS